MPIHDAPNWTMDPQAVSAVAEVAPAQREFMSQLLDTLENVDGVEFHSRISFAAEVLASQVNLLVDRLQERRKAISRMRQLGHSDAVNLMVSDIMNRALLRKLRGDD